MTAKGRPLVERPKLVGASVEDLLNFLKSPDEWTRRHAKRQLKAQGPEAVLPALRAWTVALDASEPEFEHHRLEALWTFQSLDVAEPDLLAAMLGSGDHHVRAAAARVVYHWHARLEAPLALVGPLAGDEHPQVRLEALRALSQLRNVDAAQAAVVALKKPLDESLDYALWLTMRDLAPYWLPAAREGRFDYGDDFASFEYALRAVNSPQIVDLLLETYKAGKVPSDRLAPVLSLAAAQGNAGQLRSVFDIAIDAATDAGARAALLNDLAAAARDRNVAPEGNLDGVTEAFDAEHAELLAAASRAAGLWKTAAALPKLVELAADDKRPEGVRLAAIEGLSRFGAASREALAGLANSGGASRVRVTAIGSLAGGDLAAATAGAVSLLTDPSESGWTETVMSFFLGRQGGPEALAAALQATMLPEDTAKLAIRSAQSTGKVNDALVEALRAAGGLGTGNRPLPTPEEMQALLADVREKGDPRRGEELYRSGKLICIKCHAIAGAGGEVGPDLISIGASAQVDYLIDSILLPNKAVKENFNTIVVETDQGLMHSGVKVRDTASDLVLRTSDDRVVGIAKKSIVEQANGQSLMPAGLGDALTRDELVDMVRFLSELGKVGPYSVGQKRMVRRWQVLQNTSPAVELLRRTLVGTAATEQKEFAWGSAYSTVAGLLPLDGLPTIDVSAAGSQLTIARLQLAVASVGSTALRFDSLQGLAVWVDGQPREPSELLPIDVTPGTVTITVVVDRAQRQGPLSCELVDPAENAANVQIVAGK